MILLHYSDEPLVEVRSSIQPIDRVGWPAPPKPCGLWVSVKGEDDWENWCRGEGWGLGYLKLCFRIHLSPGANILRLESAEALDQFTETFNKEIDAPGLNRYGNYIDWQRLAKLYDGIVIAPYQYSRRLAEHTFWYYSWDCASGCIWNSSAVEKITEEIEER